VRSFIDTNVLVQGNRDKFENALSLVPDVRPEESDRLPKRRAVSVKTGKRASR
jgi:hypothetical protein